jgi:hypothetical protein
MLKHLDKNNLHHAYLIEGKREYITSVVFSFLNELNISTVANPDFYHLEIDSFKMNDAVNLKALTSEKSFANGVNSKKIFILSANSFLLDAQNSLLKIFEEPIANTHFFIVTPSIQIFIPTLLSRFYVIKNEEDNSKTKEAENFVKMPLSKRIDFLKELLVAEEDEEEGNEKNSPKAKALQFLNEIETFLHSKKVLRTTSNTFQQIFKVRKYLRQPGSSAKSLMESVALSIPERL